MRPKIDDEITLWPGRTYKDFIDSLEPFCNGIEPSTRSSSLGLIRSLSRYYTEEHVRNGIIFETLRPGHTGKVRWLDVQGYWETQREEVPGIPGKRRLYASAHPEIPIQPPFSLRPRLAQQAQLQDSPPIGNDEPVIRAMWNMSSTATANVSAATSTNLSVPRPSITRSEMRRVDQKAPDTRTGHPIASEPYSTSASFRKLQGGRTPPPPAAIEPAVTIGMAGMSMTSTAKASASTSSNQYSAPFPSYGQGVTSSSRQGFASQGVNQRGFRSMPSLEDLTHQAVRESIRQQRPGEYMSPQAHESARHRLAPRDQEPLFVDHPRASGSRDDSREGPRGPPGMPGIPGITDYLYSLRHTDQRAGSSSGHAPERRDSQSNPDAGWTRGRAFRVNELLNPGGSRPSSPARGGSPSPASSDDGAFESDTDAPPQQAIHRSGTGPYNPARPRADSPMGRRAGPPARPRAASPARAGPSNTVGRSHQRGSSDEAMNAEGAKKQKTGK